MVTRVALTGCLPPRQLSAIVIQRTRGFKRFLPSWTREVHLRRIEIGRDSSSPRDDPHSFLWHAALQGSTTAPMDTEELMISCTV